MSRVAELLLAAGQARAQQLQQSAQLRAQTVENLANLPVQVMQAQRQQQLLGLQVQGEQRRQQLAQMEIAAAQQKQAEQSKLDQVWGSDIWDDNGDVDIGKATAVAQQHGFGHLIPTIRDQASKWKEQGEKTRLARTQADEAAAKLDEAHRDALGLSAIGVDPVQNRGDYEALIGTAAKQGWITNDQANQYLSLPPNAAKQQLQQFIVRSKAASERTKPRERDITKEEIDPITNQVVRPAQPKAPTNEWEAWMQSYPGTVRPGATWTTLTPQERLRAESTFVQTKQDPTAQRQAIALLAQVRQQQRTQAFQEAQAGRKELSDKVEAPYLDAREKTATLRNVIDAAKGGNMAAASVQSLMGTLGLVTAEGVKRINTTELESVAGAGSLFQRIKGEVGGLVAGQPLSPKLQDDLKELATVLDRSARRKYLQGHQTITKRYGLTDEVPLPDVSDDATGGGFPPPASSHTPTLNPRIPKF